MCLLLSPRCYLGRLVHLFAELIVYLSNMIFVFAKCIGHSSNDMVLSPEYFVLLDVKIFRTQLHS